MPAPYRLRLLCALGLLASALLARAGDLVLELRPDVLLSGPRATLAELAGIDASDPALQARLAALVVGRAPLVGQIEQRSRAELDLLLRSQALPAGQAIVWQGAPAVRMRRASQPLPADVLVGAARRYLQQRFDADRDGVDIRLDGALPELAAPLGELRLQARMAAPTRLRARMPVWVDVMVQGSLYRSVVVPLLVREQRPVYVARHALTAGGSVSAADFELRDEDVAGLSDAPLAAGSLAAPARMRQAVEAGQIATERQIAAAGAVLRGDPLRLRTAAVGMVIETAAYAESDGMVGQRIPVRPQHSSETIMAWVTAPGVVSMEGR